MDRLEKKRKKAEEDEGEEGEEEEEKEGKEEEEPGAKRHHMVSGTLAPLYSFWLKLG